MQFYSILNNDIVYNLVVPFIIAIIGCAFEAKTVKDRTQWMIGVKLYSNMRFLSLSVLTSVGCGYLFMGIKYLFINNIIDIYIFALCILTLIIFICFIYITFLRFKIEVKNKQKLLQFIFFISFIINSCLSNKGYPVINFLITLVALVAETELFRRYPYEIAYIEHKYADLFFDDNSVLNGVETYNIKKSGSWIIIKNNKDETRIPIVHLKKIDYYGRECLIKKVGETYVYLQNSKREG
ncbi:hypothetical protein [Lactonifactor longoviformis]|uniref:Uncharacterized protein n=2 Tax=Lactonifactor TaxID=420345 RepID=A0A1M5D7K9_9CLOT|nr:hypothetical protein [Lactonifactor longoviformis]SHF63039.1 hypothetical protein SAMN02745158_04446 [Lactonifactor longoviformis DSM 17459]